MCRNTSLPAAAGRGFHPAPLRARASAAPSPRRVRYPRPPARPSRSDTGPRPDPAGRQPQAARARGPGRLPPPGPAGRAQPAAIVPVRGRGQRIDGPSAANPQGTGCAAWSQGGAGPWDRRWRLRIHRRGCPADSCGWRTADSNRRCRAPQASARAELALQWECASIRFPAQRDGSPPGGRRLPPAPGRNGRNRGAAYSGFRCWLAVWRSGCRSPGSDCPAPGRCAGNRGPGSGWHAAEGSR